MKKQVYNPYLPLDTYIPDGEPHVFGDRVYIYGSHDAEGGDCFCLLDYEAWSAPVDDLTNWRCEGTIYRAKQCKHYSEERQDMYAPDVVQGNDGRYYLYYDLSGRGDHGFDGPISVAVCDTPAGTYEYYGDVQYSDGTPLRRFVPFDPAVLNDNGHIYLTYGWGFVMDTHAPIVKYFMPKIMSNTFNKSVEEIKQEEPLSVLGANLVELCDDMLTVKGEPVRILPAMNNAPKGTDFRKHSFFEAASLRKFGDLYYFIYSSQVNHELCYATSRYVDKGYTYRGVIISNGDIGYKHRKAKDRLAATGTNHGSIEQVEMTSCGLNGAPLEAKGTYPAAICCNLTNGKMPHLSNAFKNRYAPNINHEDDVRFVKDIDNNTLVGFKYFDFKGETQITVTTRGARGSLLVMTEHQKTLAKMRLEESLDWVESKSVTFYARGKQPLYLVYKGKKKIDLLQINFKDMEEK